MEWELHDIGQRCFLSLPTDDQVWTIGLSINEELTGCIANLIHSSELVVIFFSIQHRSDGHWVTPHIDLPLTLNGEVLLASTLLSYGSVLMVGDHTLTYKMRNKSLPPVDNHPVINTNIISPNSQKPPPKPARHWDTLLKSTTRTHSVKPGPVFFDSSSETTVEESSRNKKPTSLKAQHESNKDEVDLEKSMEVFQSLKDSLVNTDVELLDHIDTPEQMANVCSSYLFQFLLSKGFTMSTKEMDSIHQSMQVVSMDQAHTLLEYLRGVRAKDVISDNDHGPFLKLMRDVLLFTMDCEVSSETCMKVFVHLSADPGIARYLSQHGVVPIISACSAVYPHNVHIQTMMCRMYRHIVEAHESGMPPVKEAAIDLIIRSLGLHQGEKPFLRAALRILCALIRFHNVQGKREVTEDAMKLSDTILSHMEDHVLPVVQGIHNCTGDDPEILDMCVEIMEVLLSYRSDDSYVLIDYSEVNTERSEPVALSNSADDMTGKEIMDTENSLTKETKEEDKEDLLVGPDALHDKTDTSAVYAEVQKSLDPVDAKAVECYRHDSVLSPVQFDGDSTSKQKDPEVVDPVYVDILNESDSASSTEVEVEGDIMIDNEIYDLMDGEQMNGTEDVDVNSNDLENSHTESEYELTAEHKVEEAVTDDDIIVLSDLDEATTEKTNGHKDQNEENNLPDPKEKKSAVIKKKLGGYLSKLKPKKGQKKQKLTDGLVFEDGHKSYVHFEQFDNSIDMAFTNSPDVTPREVITISDDSQTPPEAVYGQTGDNSSVKSENFDLPQVPQSDSDSIESEFRLSPDEQGLDHELSESGEEHDFCFDNGDAEFDTFDGDKVGPNFKQRNLPLEADLNDLTNDRLIEESANRTNAYFPPAHSVSTASESSVTSKENDDIPESRSEYSEEIAQSMALRTGKKAAWVSTLKKVYEKPTSKWKNAIGMGKKVGIVENPKYNAASDNQKSSKVLLTQYRATENLSSTFTHEEEEYSGTESEHAEGSDAASASSTGNKNPDRYSSKKLTKFEALKRKNLREKLQRFPWASN